MRAKPGDLLVIEPTAPGDRRREGVVRTVWGVDSHPPYEVRWRDDDRLTLCFPGPNAHVEPSSSEATSETR